jgi:hypothetical protein
MRENTLEMVKVLEARFRTAAALIRATRGITAHYSRADH